MKGSTHTKTKTHLVTNKYKDDSIEVDKEKEIRCPYCHRLFMKGVLGKGTCIELYCRCKRFIKYKVI